MAVEKDDQGNDQRLPGIYSYQDGTNDSTRRELNRYTFHFFLQSKIKKRSWILYECLERVPTNIDDVKYLIDFGLRGTDIDSLIEINHVDNNV
jgi:hypothetical protein